MEFRRINGLPPYVFATINDLKAEARRAGRDVIDLGFGNPDLPSPDVAVEKLAEAAHNPRNHRYSASRGIPKLRSAITDLYLRKFGVELDPETEVVTTIGAKEGFSHLMWVLVGPGRHRAGAVARRTRSTSGARSSPAPTCARCRCRGRRRADRRTRPIRATPSSTASCTPGRSRGPSPGSSCSRSRTTRRPPASTSPSWSASWPSPGSTRWCSCTTSPTPTSASTATSRPRSCRCPGPRTSPSSSTP